MPLRPPRHRPGYRRTVPAPEARPAPPPRYARRESATKRGYGPAWQKARKGYLLRHPLCVHCLEHGLVTAATDVDHIVPHRGDPTLFWDFDGNVQALCKACHSRKTAAEDGGFGNQVKGPCPTT